MDSESDDLGKILLVDDVGPNGRALSILQDVGHHVVTAEDGDDALKKLDIIHDFDLLLADSEISNTDEFELYEQSRRLNEYMETIIISSYPNIKKAVKAIKLGIFDYLEKDFSAKELLDAVKKALQNKKKCEKNRVFGNKIEGKYEYENIVCKSDKIKELCNIVDKIAPTKASVMITGETGVGKESFAEAIHNKSKRKYAPFIVINCGVIPEKLLESELFGYEKDPSGALYQKPGKFEIAEGGTILLDGISEISLFMQGKILRVLEEQEFQRIGGSEKIELDVRIIVSTDKNIEEAVKNGEFRDDLYYKLNVVNIHIPSLDKRKDDIYLLALHFINKFNKEYRKNIKGISEETKEILLLYSWPGNVRELKNVIERAVAISEDMDTIILPEHLPKGLVIKVEEDFHENKKIIHFHEFEKYQMIN